MIGLARRRAAGKKLPYDAEIEYLESTGTQYIDTGVKLYGKKVFSVYYDYAPTAVNYSYNNIWSFQHISGDPWESWIDSSGYLHIRCHGLQLPTSKAAVGDRLKILAENDGSYFNGYKDGVLLKSIAYKSDVNKGLDNTIWLFRGASRGRGRMYSVWISIDNEMVFDAIPVRIGTTGYMYDKVSKQLFGNAGTGEFVLGPDV